MIKVQKRNVQLQIAEKDLKAYEGRGWVKVEVKEPKEPKPPKEPKEPKPPEPPQE